MERSGFAPVGLIALGAFMLGALMFGGAATAGAAVMWPFFALFKVVLLFLLIGFIARAFRGRGWDRRPYRGAPDGRRDWPGPWAERPQRSERDGDEDDAARDPRAWFEQRAEDWHLKAHARMDIDRLVPDPTRDDAAGRTDDRDSA